MSERVSGTWNRASVAGVKPIHFLWSHLIERSAFVVYMNLEISLYLKLVLMPEITWKALALASSIFFLEGTVGMLFGIFFSIIMDTAMTSILVSQTTVYAPLFLSGLLIKRKTLLVIDFFSP